MPLCFGDGTADIFGQYRKGNHSLPWNNRKTLYGLLSFVVFSTLSCFLYGLYFELYVPSAALFLYESHRNHWTSLQIYDHLYNCFCLSVGAALTETFTVPEWDNVSICLMSILLSRVLLN